MRCAIVHASYYEKASYNDDWLDAILNYDDDFDSYNLEQLDLKSYIKILKNYDYVILLHSTNSNGFRFNRLIQNGGLRYRKGKIVLFVGNEYKLMKEKIDFIKKNKIEYVVSQLDIDVAKWLYEETEAKVISLPHALGKNLLNHKTHFSQRKIDFGLRAGSYPRYLGHSDRKLIFSFISKLPENWIIDASDDESQRFNRKDWALFLNNCKFTVACEGGSDFLERDDKSRLMINNFVAKNPDATDQEIYNNFYLNYTGEGLKARTITGRVFDAIGAFTCQVLVEGKYNGILEPDKHYIEIKKDLSNITEVLEKTKDEKFVEEMCEKAYSTIVESHLYEHRIEKLFKEL